MIKIRHLNHSVSMAPQVGLEPRHPLLRCPNIRFYCGLFDRFAILSSLSHPQDALVDDAVEQPSSVNLVVVEEILPLSNKKRHPLDVSFCWLPK